MGRDIFIAGQFLFATESRTFLESFLLYGPPACLSLILPQSHPDLATLKATHYQHLLDSGQEERAGKMKEREGDLPGAISLYMKAGLPGKAAKLISQHQV